MNFPEGSKELLYQHDVEKFLIWKELRSKDCKMKVHVFKTNANIYKTRSSV